MYVDVRPFLQHGSSSVNPTLLAEDMEHRVTLLGIDDLSIKTLYFNLSAGGLLALKDLMASTLLRNTVATAVTNNPCWLINSIGCDNKRLEVYEQSCFYRLWMEDIQLCGGDLRKSIHGGIEPG